MRSEPSIAEAIKNDESAVASPIEDVALLGVAKLDDTEFDVPPTKKSGDVSTICAVSFLTKNRDTTKIAGFPHRGSLGEVT